jgi:hypothetical protein
LRESARKEFESARNERDPLIIARLLVVGQDALMQAQYKVDALKGDMTRKVGSSPVFFFLHCPSTLVLCSTGRSRKPALGFDDEKSLKCNRTAP